VCGGTCTWAIRRSCSLLLRSRLLYRVLPDGPQRVKLLTTLLVLPEAKQMPDYEQRLAAEIEMLKTFHTEDMEVCVAVQKGMNSSHSAGRLSHLEVPIWHIQRYLARKLR